MADIVYTHVLDDQGRCNCGNFAVPLSHPDFTRLASAHYIATTAQTVRDQTGWRGLWNRLWGKR